MTAPDDKHKTRAFRYTTTKINPADLAALQKAPEADPSPPVPKLPDPSKP